ncbi:hypothetical protein BJ912DRAFT_1018769 [Pholiota molesta]|nr:hypothetical protein BJ912DRAFT_1018769 [Pholiota molesta]
MVKKTINSTKTLLPGFGRSLNYVPSKRQPDYIGDCFKSALPLTTVREFVMLQFMNTITDKPDWYIKVNNPEIAGKWKEEALASDHEDLTAKVVDYCLDELRYKSTLIPAPPAQLPPVVVYNGDVVKSDTALSPEFKEELQQAIKTFETKIPEKLRDWHPGSDGKVWDLVHPSLFPLVYGRTRDCIDKCGQGTVTKIPPERESVEIGQDYGGGKAPYSRKFQWLPCEVDISGNETRITSYINNLHPQQEKPLYHLMEKLIDASIPLWDLTLAPLKSTDFTHQLRIKYDVVDYKEDTEEGQKAPFAPLPSPPQFSLREEYGKRGLQVIVKLANIELTPEKPQYDGGSWHIEGQLNEHIVATALYYYSNSNITPSNLSFRQWFSGEDTIGINYEQDRTAWLNPIYGCEQEGPSVQDVGGVDTREGRLLTFPNILQHCVGPFKLADPTKPGHRKIVALFLIDPHIKIISTAHVPCQQQEWCLREAKILREELMEERKEFSFAHSESLESEFTISLCEH